MTNSLSVAISGLRAAAARHNSASRNLANMNSLNFRRETVIQQEDASGGVTVSINRDMNPLTSANGEGSADIASDMVELIRAKHQLMASIKAIKSEDQNMGAILNIIA